MTSPPLCSCGLWTQDMALAQRLTTALEDVTSIQLCVRELPSTCVPHLWLLDLRAKTAIDIIRALREKVSPLTIVALGVPGSIPWRDARQMDLYALVDVNTESADLCDLVRRAAERADLLMELAELRANQPATPTTPPPTGPIPASSDLKTFPAALRSFDNVDTTLCSLVEGIAQWTHTTRAGLFCRSPRQPDRYVMRAALRPPSGAVSWSARLDDAIPQWLARTLQFVVRSHLERVTDRRLRDVFAQAMECWGAEVIIPLQLRAELAGWLFVGPRLTGQPFDEPSLVQLAPIADYAATILDNALLYETAALQRTLIEIVLETMPTGVVVVDLEAIVRRCNEAACSIFACSLENVLNHPIETMSSQLANLVRSALEGRASKDPQEWMEAATRRQISGQARVLSDGRRELGAVAFVHDLTVEHLLASKQEQMDRAAFWTELAAAMSHEVRNPLVAIKTFAQLLPERFLDKDFRTEFAQTVNSEIGRLESIIEQIHQFAHPPPLIWSAVSVPRIIQRALEDVLSGDHGAGIWVETSIAEKLPSVEGDENALAQCIGHLLTNAAEALKGRVNPKIVVSANPLQDNDETASGVLIAIQDNGPGIRPEIRAKVFSPFCTTKARGLGLGLPIAKRIVVDHGGQIDVETTEHGTCVFIRLPAARKQTRSMGAPSARRKNNAEGQRG